MAHFLSQVTLSKLDARRETVTATDGIAGIRNVADVEGFFRCVTSAWMLREGPASNRLAASALGSGSFSGPVNDSIVAPDGLGSGTEASARSTMSKVVSMWCGEQDGSISVRSFATGQRLLSIDAKTKVFVFSLLDVCAGVIWAGLSDGFIRVFDSFTHRLIDELRAHCGSVTAMVSARMPTSASAKHSKGLDFSQPLPPPTDSMQSVVITASNDWTVAVWDVSAVHSSEDPMRRNAGMCICRLNAHQNAVRTLAVDHRSGGHIFASGADDGSIRLWDLAKLAAEDASLGDPDATSLTQGGHRRAFRTATSCASAAFGNWPVLGAHAGAVTQLVFCGDSEAEVSTAERKFDAHDDKVSSNHAHRHRRDLVTAAYSSRTKEARKVAARLMAQEPRHNKFVLSAGHDGAVRLWSKRSGALCCEVEVRPCPVSCLMLDPVHSRLWIGGVDSVITIYDENTLDHIATLHDHSGSYIVDFHAVPGVATVNLWAVDANGDMHQSKYGSRSAATDEDDEMEDMERSLLGLIHGLRATVISNYDTLQDLRSETEYLTSLDDRRKRSLAAIVGSNNGLKQRYLLALEQWRTAHRGRVNAGIIASWLSHLSTSATLRKWYTLWRRHIRSVRHGKVVDMLSDGLKASRDAALRRRYILLLHKAASQKERFIRLRRNAGIVFASNNRAMMQLYYYRWQRFAMQRRELKAREVVAGIILRSSDQAMLQEYWNRLAETADMTEARRKRDFVLRTLTRGSGMGLLNAYFRKWLDARPYLKAARVERMSVNVLYATRARALQKVYFAKWLNALSTLRARHADEKERQLRKERDEWHALFESNSGITTETLADRRAQLEAKRARLREHHADRARTIMEEQALVNSLHRRKFISSANLDPHAPIDVQCKTLMDLLKARGVNCGYDGAVIDKAREHCSMLERGVNIPGEAPLSPGMLNRSPSGVGSFGRAPSQSALQRAPSQSGMNRTPSSPSMHRAPSQAGMQRTPSGRNMSPTGRAGSPTSASRAAKPPVDIGMQRALRRLKQELFDVSINAGYRHIPKEAEVTGELPATATDDEAGDMDGSRQEWGVPTTVLSQLRTKERRAVMLALKELIVCYDVAANAVLAGKLSAPASARSASKTPSGPQFRPGLLREFVVNSHLFLMLAQHEYEHAIKVGATAGDAYKDDSATPQQQTRRRGVSLTRSGAKPRTPTPPAAAVETDASSAAGGEAGVSASGKPLTRTEVLKQQQLKQRAEAMQRLEKIQKPKTVTKSDLDKEAKSDKSRMRPYMGFRVEPFKARTGSGLKVAQVAEASPAEEAKFEVGDIVVRFANVKVSDLPSFNATVSRHATIGKSLPVILQRGAEKITTTLGVTGRFPDATS